MKVSKEDWLKINSDRLGKVSIEKSSQIKSNQVTLLEFGLRHNQYLTILFCQFYSLRMLKQKLDQIAHKPLEQNHSEQNNAQMGC